MLLLSTNQRAIIDNATLSGVERLIGASQVKNLSYIDNDIACFEKLITAILFNDTIIGIDDYKDQYRSARLKNFDFIEFKKVPEEEYARVSKDAANFASSMTFSIANSKPAGDVVSFFDSLRLDPQLRWNVFVSSEYLTFTYLTNDQYGNYGNRYHRSADTLFRSEQTDAKLVSSEESFQPSFSVSGSNSIKDLKDLVSELAKSNPNFSGEDSKSALSRAFFGYGWAAERSKFYNDMAYLEGANPYLAPLRDAFCESCCRIDYPSQINGLLKSLSNNTQSALEKILTPSGQSYFAIKMPFFTSYLISKTDNPQQCIEHARELSREKDFQECKVILHNLAHIPHGQRTAEINKIFQYLEQSCNNLLKKYGVTTGNGLMFSASLGTSGASVSVGGKLSGLLRPYRNRPFARVFKNIAQEMLTIERMGELHDKLCSSMRKHKDSLHSDVSTTPKFMENKESQYGRPASL